MNRSIDKSLLLQFIALSSKCNSTLSVLETVSQFFLQQLHVAGFAYEHNDSSVHYLQPNNQSNQAIYQLVKEQIALRPKENSINFFNITHNNAFAYCYNPSNAGFICIMIPEAVAPESKEKLDTIMSYAFHTIHQFSENAPRNATKDIFNVIKNILDDFTDAIHLTEESGRLYYINRTAAKRLGIPQEECSKYWVSDFEEIFKDMSIWHQHVEDIKKAGIDIIEGINVNQTTGEILPVEVTARVISINDKNYVLANIKDISQRKNADAIIQRQMEMQQILLDISSKYINISLDEVAETITHSLESMCRFVSADRAYIFEYDLSNETCSNTFEWCAEGIEAEINNLQQIPVAYFPNWLERHKKGEPFYIPQVAQLPDDGPNGLKAILAAQSIKSLITIPMLHGKNLLGFVGFDSVKKEYAYSEKEKTILTLFASMLVNIQDRQRKEKRLQIQEEKYRNIIANMNLGLLELDTEGHIVYCNSSFCHLSGYRFNELIGQKASHFIHARYHQNILEQHYDLGRNSTSETSEVQISNKTGAERWWLISGAPNFNDQGEAIGSIVIHLDITQSKLLEQELERALNKATAAVKAKDIFLANMSHEIRTPLNAIIGIIRELNRSNLSAAQNTYLLHGKTASKHLLSIVNNVLDMSKIEASELSLEEKEFSLVSVINMVESILMVKAEEKGLTFNIEIDPNIKPALIGDSVRLRQILINIIGNSIKFTEHGSIRLQVQVEDSSTHFQKIKFNITDTGIGISKHFLENIFEKFTQETNENSPKQEGTGLGLAISKEIIHLMGGTLNIHSEKGLGTSVVITLTLAIGDQHNIFNQVDLKLDNRLHGLKCLLVEDNSMNRLIASNSLKFFGCQITEAENGKAAIEQLLKEDFDIILMDIQMPIMDGIEATKYIRNIMQIETPIIALTANAFKNDIELYLSIGMNDYVTKPFEERMLFNTIAQSQKGINDNIRPMLGGQTPLEDDLYTLDGIKKLCRNDQKLIDKVINLFISEAPEILQSMKDAYQKKEYTTIAKQAHKLKSSIDNMQIKPLQASIRNIESEAQTTNPEDHKLLNLIAYTDEILKDVIAQLKYNN